MCATNGASRSHDELILAEHFYGTTVTMARRIKRETVLIYTQCISFSSGTFPNVHTGGQLLILYHALFTHQSLCHPALGSASALAEPRLLNEKLNIIVDILGGVIVPMLHAYGRTHLQAILQ